jgi:hypothetical protein
MSSMGAGHCPAIYPLTLNVPLATGLLSIAWSGRKYVTSGFPSQVLSSQGHSGRDTCILALVFRRWRLKKIHARFLESCRSLTQGRNYWSQGGAFRKWFLQTITPFPLLGLLDDGALILAAPDWLESSCRARILDQEVIRHYHLNLLNGGTARAGEYRKTNVSVVGSSIPRPAPAKVPTLMNQMELKFTELQCAFDKASTVDREESPVRRWEWPRGPAIYESLAASIWAGLRSASTFGGIARAFSRLGRSTSRSD